MSRRSLSRNLRSCHVLSRVADRFAIGYPAPGPTLEVPVPIDTKTLAAILGAIGVLTLAAAGILQITTPEAAECERARAAAEARVELMGTAIGECKTALKERAP